MSEEEMARRAEELGKIRPTDNSARPGDGPQPPQDPKPLEMDADGLPAGVAVGGGE